VDVTGHSLGGHLALAFARLFPEFTDHVYTYNAPGFTVEDPHVDGFFDMLGEGATSFPAAEQITNIFANESLSSDEPGFEAIAGLHTLPGGEPDYRAYVETQTPPTTEPDRPPAKNHSQMILTDSLALHDLVADLSPATGFQAFADLLNATANESHKSIETFLATLRRLFVGPDDPYANSFSSGNTTPARDEFYDNLINLREDNAKFDSAKGKLTFVNLARLSPGSLSEAAKVSAGYLYALEELNSFALIGDGSLYGGLDFVDFSEKYLIDRASLLEDKLLRAVNDYAVSDFGPHPFSSGPYAGEPVHYVDIASGYDVDVYANAGLGTTIIFDADTNSGDPLQGSHHVDHIYGREGDDILQGVGGDDYLDGGQGTDVYVYNSGDGFDTIFDSDGLGEIRFNGIALSGGAQTTTGANTWYDAALDIRYTLDTSQGNGLLTVTHGNDDLQVLDFQSGELGINLQPYAETPFTDTTVYQVINLAAGDDPEAIGNLIDQEIWGLPDSDFLTLGGPAKHRVFAGGGDDIVFEDSTGDTSPSDDTFHGEAGRDALEAGAGADRLSGGTEQDLVAGMDGEDYLEGNGGSDVLTGGAGSDTLKGGAGDDDLWGDATWSSIDPTWAAARTGSFKVDLGFSYTNITGADISSNDAVDELYGGDGDDLLLGGGDDDLMFGEADRDTLLGQYGHDYLDGGVGDDHLRGDVKVGALIDDPENLGHDVLIGGSGNDLLEGGFGDDVIFGGNDNDVLQGDFNSKPEWAGDDHLDGGEGNDDLRGGRGRDTLIGGAGEDRLEGGQGDDRLEGDAGSDVYVINANEGSDVVLDRDTALNTDRVELGKWLTSDRARLTRLGSNLVIGFANTANSVTITNYFEGPEFEIEELRFADGVVWSPAVVGAAFADVPMGQALQIGTDQDDSLTGDAGDNALFAGSGADQLDGGPGNDTLIGGEGDDVYLIDADDGDDVIVDREASANTDKLVFGDWLTVIRARLVRSGSDLKIAFADTENAVTLKDYFLDPAYEIEEISFTSGITWTLDQIKAAFTQVPQDSNLTIGPGYGATLLGDTQKNVILAGDEQDYLYGRGGDDLLIGGAGDDELIGTGFDDGRDTFIGGAGDDKLFDRDPGTADTYIFNLGDGQDVLQDSGGGFDVLRFPGITPADVFVSKTVDGSDIDRDLVVGIRGKRDRVTVDGFFEPNYAGILANEIERIEFDDGSAWSLQQILERIEATPGSELDDLMYGTDAGETMDALGGDDTVYGYAGDDTLIGGAGNDDLSAGAGDDIASGGPGEDSIQGDAGDDQLSGGDGNDVLTGGPGRDILDGGAGNDTLITGTGGSRVFAGEGDDSIVINGSDVIDTGAGDNTLWFASNPGGSSVVTAGSGGNHYIFSSNYGSVTIHGGGWGGTGARPVATFSGYDSSSRFSFGLGSLVIHAEDGSELHLTDFDPHDVYGFSTIGSFRFSDGVELSYAQFISQGFDITGTGGDDLLSGTNITDRMVGLDGDDRLSAGEGDDTLAGGAGNDSLQGGAGADTYVFTLGDGIDRLIDSEAADADNRIRFGPGIAPADLHLAAHSSSVIIEVGDGGDLIQLEHPDPIAGDPSNVVRTLEFDDGSTIPLAALIPADSIPEPILGTSGRDVMIGTGQDDRIDADAGDDIVLGLKGNDLIFGGEGRDLLFGGVGDDRFVVAGDDAGHDQFYGGSGRDSIVGGLDDDAVHLHRFAAHNSIEVIDGGAGINRISGSPTADVIDLSATVVYNMNELDAGDGDDRVAATAGADRLNGGRGRDVLEGGAGDDVYLFGRGDGQDLLLETGSDLEGDRLALEADIRHDQLWFSRIEDDLRIDVIGSADEVVVDRWYGGADHQIEQIRAGDGFALASSRVDQLVQAMAAFAPPSEGELDLSPPLRDQLEPVLAASWEAA
jgi:Ca2+-binding RTX toxin-like protein